MAYNSLSLVIIDDATPEQMPDVGGQRIDLAPITVDGKCEKLTILKPEVLIKTSLQFSSFAF